MHLIQEDQSQDVANPGDRWPPVQRLGMGLLGRVDEGSLQGVESLVVVSNEPEVDRKTLWHGRIGKPLRDASPVRLIRQLLAHLGQMVLAVGLLHRREPLGPFAREMQAAPEEITGRPHRGGIDIGLREHPATQQHGDLLGVARVVCGLAAVDRFHLQRVPEDNGHLCLGAEVGEPVPGQETFERADQLRPLGCPGLEKRLRTGVHGAMPQDLAVLAKETHVQAASMQIKAALRFGLLGVESPEVSSASRGCLPNASRPRRYAEEGASISINTLQRTGGQRRVVAWWPRQKLVVVLPPRLSVTVRGCRFNRRSHIQSHILIWCLAFSSASLVP
jgi:hypothetical protein